MYETFEYVINVLLRRFSAQQEVGGTHQNLEIFLTFLEPAAAAPCDPCVVGYTFFFKAL
jgi:hypothetical protein